MKDSDVEQYLMALVESGVSPEDAAKRMRQIARGPNPVLDSTGSAPDAAAVPKKTAKRARKEVLPSRSEKVIEASALIAGSLPNLGEDAAFIHAVLCQVGLPRSKVEGREFMRKSGAAWVSVEAGYLDEGSGPVLQPVPYGVMPRLALSWVSTFAVRHKSREIPLGDSAGSFLKLMGVSDTQGKRFNTLRQQMHALAACRLQMGFSGRTFNGQPVQQFDAWVSSEDARNGPLWPGMMVLSEDYYDSLIKSAVPLDNRALTALTGSALALDIYCWLANRLHRIEGKGVLLHWKSLREQFGQEYTGPEADKNFKEPFLNALRMVLSVYPKANVTQVKGGFLLAGSPPPIPFKTTPTG